MEYAVDKSNARTLVWILVGQLYMNFPETTSEWSYSMVNDVKYESQGLAHTLFWTLKANIKFLPVEKLNEHRMQNYFLEN